MSRTAAEGEDESPGARLRALVTERHEAFVQDMWTLFESTVAQLEDQVRALRAEKEQQQREVSALLLCQGPVGGEESWEELTVEASESEDLPPHTEHRPGRGGSLGEETEGGGLQTQETQCGDLQTDVKVEPGCGGLQTQETRCGDLQTEGPECGDLQTDIEVEFEYEGLPMEEPDCGGLQTDAGEEPSGRGLQTDAGEGSSGRGLQTDAGEEPLGRGLQTDAGEGPSGRGLQTEGPECGDLQTDIEVEFEYEGLPIEEPDCGGLQTDADEEPSGRGLQTDADEEPSGRGLQTDADEKPSGRGLQTDADEKPSGRGLQTEEPKRGVLSQNECLRRWIMKRMTKMRPMIVLRRYDAKPAEDLNSSELTENSSDSEDEEDHLRRKRSPKKCLEKSTGITQGTDTEASSDAEIQPEDLLLEVIVLIDSGDEEGGACDENSQTCASEDLDVNVAEEDLFSGEKRENISQRKTSRRQVSRKTKALQRCQAKKENDCSVCGKSMFSKSALRLHQRDHSNKRLLDCKYCGHRRAALPGDAEAAGTSQSKSPTPGALPGQASCSVLLEVSSISHLARNKKTLKEKSEKGGQTSEAKCELCLTKFPSKQQLKKHMSSHKIKGELHCPACPKKFSYYSELKRHVVCHKTGPSVSRKQRCSLCQMEFLSVSKYRRHCSLHKQRHKDLASLQRHQVIHRDTETKKKEKEEESKVSENGSPGKLQCSVCLRTFLLIHNFCKHVLLHKTKTCLVCGKVFRSNFYVRRHMMTHTGEKPFRCSVCGKRYTDKRSLADHVVTRHQK